MSQLQSHSHPILNLIKYDLKFIYKQLIVFYIIVLVLAVVARCTDFETPVFLVRFIHEFAQGATFGFSLGMIINASLRTWARFRQTLYGDESYLTHTLPINRTTLITAKFLTGIIIVAISILLFIICMLILFLSPENLALLRDDAWLTIIFFAISVFCQFVFMMEIGLTSILLGYHRNPNSPVAFAVAYGIAIYLISGALMMALGILWGLVDPMVYDMLFDDAMMDIVTVHKMLSFIGILYIIFTTALYFIDRKLLQKGVNVD